MGKHLFRNIDELEKLFDNFLHTRELKKKGYDVNLLKPALAFKEAYLKIFSNNIFDPELIKEEDGLKVIEVGESFFLILKNNHNKGNTKEVIKRFFKKSKDYSQLQILVECSSLNIFNFNIWDYKNSTYYPKWIKKLFLKKYKTYCLESINFDLDYENDLSLYNDIEKIAKISHLLISKGIIRDIPFSPIIVPYDTPYRDKKLGFYLPILPNYNNQGEEHLFTSSTNNKLDMPLISKNGTNSIYVGDKCFEGYTTTINLSLNKIIETLLKL